ncbi:hypothetical protein BX600DRAFT_419444 [Xylariales sp. PMI_506]|nr:hypothetical protein BX600DRAFT_419444 [Xylariales sp. PMI_506]
MASVDDRLSLAAICIGVPILVYWCYGLIFNLVFFLFPPRGVGRYLKPPKADTAGAAQEPWALITGSSSGIGQGLAFEFARQGFNIVLHGSNSTKLRAVQEKLRKAEPNRSVRVLEFDARECVTLDKDSLTTRLDGIARSLEDIQLRVLINNAGTSHARRARNRPMCDAIDGFTYDELRHNASLNAIFPILLTRALYPQLIRNQPALIINIGSIASMGLPLFPTYGPSKAFTLTSAAELRLENRIEDRDIEVLGVNLMSVAETGEGNGAPRFMVPPVETFAKALMRCIGCGYPCVVPYFPHAVAISVVQMLPQWLYDWVWSAALKAKRQEDEEKLAIVAKSA